MIFIILGIFIALFALTEWDKARQSKRYLEAEWDASYNRIVKQIEKERNEKNSSNSSNS